MEQVNLDENGRDQAVLQADEAGQAASSDSAIKRRSRKAVAFLLTGDALQLVLFGLLVVSIHIYPLLPIDVDITRSFQQNQVPWLRMTMLVVSYRGSSFLLPALVMLAVAQGLLEHRLRLRSSIHQE